MKYARASGEKGANLSIDGTDTVFVPTSGEKEVGL